MKKYALFTTTKLVPSYELSVSNKIMEKEPLPKVLSIVTDWIRTIVPGAKVVYRTGASLDSYFATISIVGDIVGEVDNDWLIQALKKESNVRFRLCKLETTYTPEPVS